MPDLYGRRVRLTFGVPGEGAAVADSGVPPARGFRISFSIWKSIKSALNNGTVQVWNLAPSTRARIRTDGTRFAVEAGYRDDATLAVLFRGQVTRAATERQGGDLVTTIECADGYDAVQEAEVEELDRRGRPHGVKVPRGTGLAALVRRVASFLTATGDVVLGDIDAALTGIVAAATVRGQQTVMRRPQVFEGRVADALDSLGRSYHFDWSVQDGVLELHPWDAIWRGDIVTVSPATGLIEPGPAQIQQSTLLSAASLLPGASHKHGETAPVDGVRFRSLLRPEIRPGALVRVESAAVSGIWRVHVASYDGDSEAGEFVVDAEAFTIPGAAGA